VGGTVQDELGLITTLGILFITAFNFVLLSNGGSLLKKLFEFAKQKEKGKDKERKERERKKKKKK